VGERKWELWVRSRDDIENRKATGVTHQNPLTSSGNMAVIRGIHLAAWDLRLAGRLLIADSVIKFRRTLFDYGTPFRSPFTKVASIASRQNAFISQLEVQVIEKSTRQTGKRKITF
jgi:hypothetical protein